MQHLLFKDLPPASDKGLGGGEVAAIFGLSSHLSPLELWERKMDRAEAPAPHISQLRGVRLEPYVKSLFEAVSGERVKSGVRAKHRRWHEGVRMIAATDGMLSRGEVFEAKTTLAGTRRARDFEAGRAPHAYALQVLQYAAVTGAPTGVLCGLVGPSEEGLPWSLAECALHCLYWERSEALVSLLESSVKGWFERHILGDVPPEGPAPESEQVRALLESEPWIVRHDATIGLEGVASSLADDVGLKI